MKKKKSFMLSCSGQGKTPKVPSNLKPAEGDDEEDTMDKDLVKNEQAEVEEPKRKMHVTLKTEQNETCARTDGELKRNAARRDFKPAECEEYGGATMDQDQDVVKIEPPEVEEAKRKPYITVSTRTDGKLKHKSVCSKRVEKNRKEIVEAGKEVRKKRKKRASKKDVYYFFDTQCHVDNKVHFSELECGVVTDDSSASEQATVKRKSKKKKLVVPSSSENEMFLTDEGEANSLDAAAASASALLENPAIQYALEKDDSLGCVESVPKGNEFTDSAENVLNEPDFGIIFRELDKIDETDEVDDIKEWIVRLMEKISEPKHPDACSKNLSRVQLFKLKLDYTKAKKVLSEENSTLDDLVGEEGVGDVDDEVVEDALSDYLSTNKPEQDISDVNNVKDNSETETQERMENVLKNPATNDVLLTTTSRAQSVQHSSFIIHDQYGNPSMVTVPSDTTFVVQNFVSYVPVTNANPAVKGNDVLGELPESKNDGAVKDNGILDLENKIDEETGKKDGTDLDSTKRCETDGESASDMESNKDEGKKSDKETDKVEHKEDIELDKDEETITDKKTDENDLNEESEFVLKKDITGTSEVDESEKITKNSKTDGDSHSESDSESDKDEEKISDKEMDEKE